MKDKSKEVMIWSYTFKNKTEWRWLCASDNIGEDGFKSFADARHDAEAKGYWVTD